MAVAVEVAEGVAVAVEVDVGVSVEVDVAGTAVVGGSAVNVAVGAWEL